MRKGYCRIHEICTLRWAEFFPDGSRRGAIHLHGHDAATSRKSVSTPLHLSHLPTRSPFGSGMQSSCQRGWHEASPCYARGRHASLLGEILGQVGGKGLERGEKEAFGALSLLQQLLCQMYWSRASQLHLADGTEQPEGSCWDYGAASTAKMRSIMGSEGPLAPQ